MKKILSSIAVIFCYTTSFTQNIILERQVISSTGNYIDAGTIIATSTVGEAVIPTFLQSTLIVTQGFQQPISDTNTIDIFSTVGINDIQPLGAIISVYPNPTSSKIILDITLKIESDISIQIYNALGQSLSTQSNITIQGNTKRELDFTAYAVGNYYIHLKSTENTLNKMFKVQKSK